MYSRAPEVTSSWGKVFANASGVADALVAYWAVVAETFAGVEGVLGYDLVNEPLNGDFFEDATLLEPGAADRRLLEPLYGRMAAAIRERDADAILFFESTPFPDTYPSNIPVLGGVHAAGFAEAPGGNAALSYHIYSCGFAATDCDRNGDVPGVDCDACDAFAEAAGATRSSDARRLGAAAFLTEFGACSGSASCLAEISRVADVADAHLHSWAYWQFESASRGRDGFRALLTGEPLSGSSTSTTSRRSPAPRRVSTTPTALSRRPRSRPCGGPTLRPSPARRRRCATAPAARSASGTRRPAG